MNYIEFSQKIKSKYPVYSDIDDLELSKKIVEKHPSYSDKVEFDMVEEPKKKSLPDLAPSFSAAINPFQKIAPQIISPLQQRSVDIAQSPAIPLATEQVGEVLKTTGQAIAGQPEAVSSVATKWETGPDIAAEKVNEILYRLYPYEHNIQEQSPVEAARGVLTHLAKVTTGNPEAIFEQAQAIPPLVSMPAKLSMISGNAIGTAVTALAKRGILNNAIKVMESKLLKAGYKIDDIVKIENAVKSKVRAFEDKITPETAIKLNIGTRKAKIPEYFEQPQGKGGPRGIEAPKQAEQPPMALGQPKMPNEPEIRTIVEQQGGKWRGIQEGFDDVPGMVMFNEPTGSTLAIPIDRFSAEAVAKKLSDFKKPESPQKPQIEGIKQPHEIIAKEMQPDGTTIPVYKPTEAVKPLETAPIQPETAIGAKDDNWSEMYQRGMDNTKQFAYIPDFKNATEKADYLRGYAEGKKINNAIGAPKPEMTLYRGGGEGSMPKGKTAQDIVNYEKTELGNADVVPEKGIDLKTIKSDNLKWFADTKEAAKEYGDVTENKGNYRIIARDGQGGVLIEPTPKAVTPTKGGKVYYRGDNTTRIRLNNAGEITLTTDKSVATEFAKKYGDKGVVNEVRLNPNAKILDVSKINEAAKSEIIEGYGSFSEANITDYAKDEKYDAIDFSGLSKKGVGYLSEIKILNEKAISTPPPTEGKVAEEPLIAEARKYKTADEFVKGKKVYYHVTPTENIGSIQKKGIFQPADESKLSKNMVGGILSDKGTTYVFENYDDALRWAARGDFGGEGQSIIKIISNNPMTKDTHFESSMSHGGWFKIKGGIKPENIIGIEKYDKEFGKQLVNSSRGFGKPIEDNQLKSQLTEIWNKAQEGKVAPKAGEILKEYTKFPVGKEITHNGEKFEVVKNNKDLTTTIRWKEGYMGGQETTIPSGRLADENPHLINKPLATTTKKGISFDEVTQKEALILRKINPDKALLQEALINKDLSAKLRKVIARGMEKGYSDDKIAMAVRKIMPKAEVKPLNIKKNQYALQQMKNDLGEIQWGKVWPIFAEGTKDIVGWGGAKSSFPNWYSKTMGHPRNISNAIEKLFKGEPISPRMTEIVEGAVAAIRQEQVNKSLNLRENLRMERKQGPIKTENAIKADIKELIKLSKSGDLTIKEGETYTINDEEYRVIDITKKDIKLQDGVKVTYDKETGDIDISKKTNLKPLEKEPKLFEVQPEVPKKPLRTAEEQVEHRNLLEGFKAEEEPPELPGVKEPKAKYGDAPEFYSKLQRTLTEKMPNVATVDQMKGVIKDVKAEEIKWSGITDFVKGKEKINKQELLDYLKGNEIQVKEVQKGGEGEVVDFESVPEKLKKDVVRLENDEIGQIEFQKIAERQGYEVEFEMGGEIESFTKKGNKPTKFSNYTLPGGKNYRELLFTLPGKETKLARDLLGGKPKIYTDTKLAEKDYGQTLEGKEKLLVYPSGPYIKQLNDNKYLVEIYDGQETFDNLTLAESYLYKNFAVENNIGEKSSNFLSSHWDEPNVIAHTRINDRTTPSGEKVLFIEEIQSDWAIEGRKKGFKKSLSKEEASVIWKKENDDLIERLKAGENLTYTGNRLGDERYNEISLENQLKDRKEFEANGINDMQYNRILKQNDGIPNAPLLKNWQEFTLKKILRKAVDEGYDRVAWVNGQQTADRYNLAKYINSVDWGPLRENDKYISIYPKGQRAFALEVDSKGTVLVARGLEAAGQQWEGKNISDVIGKDLTEKIMKQDTGEISEKGLSIGGDWAKTLYDQQIPNTMNKLGKKWGAKVENTKLQTTGAIKNSEKIQTVEEGLSWLTEGNEIWYEITDEPGMFTSVEDPVEWEEMFEDGVVDDDYYMIDPAKESVAYLEQQSLPITPEMRKGVKSEGFSLFEKGAQYDIQSKTKQDLLANRQSSKIQDTPFILKYKKERYFHFPKEKITSPSDVAFAFKELEKSTTEKGYIVGVKSGKPLFVQCLGVGTVNKAAMYPYEGIDLLSKKGADGFYLVHNHPGGSVTPSVQDIDLTKGFAKSYKNIDVAYQGHIIIDHNKFGFMDNNNVASVIPLKEGVSVKKVPQLSPREEWRGEYPSKTLGSPQIVAEYIKETNVNMKDNTLVIAMDSNNQIISTELFSHKKINAKEIVKMAANARAVGIIASNFPNSKMAARELKEALENSDIALLDIVNLRSAGGYFSAKSVGELGEPGAKYTSKPSKEVSVKEPNLEDSEEARNFIKDKWTDIREFIEDDWVRVKKLIQQKGANVTETNNPYEAEIRYWGRVGTRMEKTNTAIEEIDKDLLNTARKNKIDDVLFNKEIDKYLIAKHAPERNAVHGENAAGMADKEAKVILSELERKPYAKELKRIAGKIQELNKQTLDILLEGEVISKESYDNLREIYPNHIPLQRVMNENEDIMQVLSGRGFSVQGTGLKRAKGSEREVSDILSNVTANLKGAIARAEKNIVDNYTARLAKENDYFDGLFEEIKPKAIGKTFDDKFIMNRITDPEVLPYREKGEQKYLKINDPRLASALRGINRHKVEGIIRGVKAFTRFYSSLMTRFNPEFALPNKIRDLQETAVYLMSKPEIGIRGGIKAISRDIGSIKDVFDAVRGKDTPGAKLYNQMKDDGGTTGGLGLSTKEQVEIDIEKIRAINRSAPRKGAEILFKSIDSWNQIFEDSTRLSVYRQALKQGISRNRASVLAKEASINFNKMGTGSPVLNGIYMFSNASVQGSAKMLRALRNPKVAGFVVLALGTGLAAVNEYNDKIDPKWRSKVSKWDKLNGLNVVLPTKDGIRYVSLPISWGLKPIKVTLEAVLDMVSGHEKSVSGAVGDMFTALMEGYNPAGGTDVISAITPTILDLPVDLARNKSWTGGKIRPDWNQSAPNSIRYFDSLRKKAGGRVFIGKTKELSEKGIEISPAAANYAFETYIGGTGRFFNKIINTVSGVVKGDVKAKEIPFVSRLYRDIPEEQIFERNDDFKSIKKQLERQSKDRFYLNQEAELAWEGMKNIPKEKAKEHLREIYKTSPEVALKIIEISKDEKLNLNYTDRMIKQLGVANGERANFLWNKIKDMKTKEEQRNYYKQMKQKKLISDEVLKQIKGLSKQKT